MCEMNKSKKEKTSGITVIALVVTIVILIIIASISVNIILKSGMLDKTVDAKDSFENSQSTTKSEISELLNYTKNPDETDEPDESGGTGGSGDTDEPDIPGRTFFIYVTSQGNYLDYKRNYEEYGTGNLKENIITGAVIEIYSNKECSGTPIATLDMKEGYYDSSNNILPKGKYYVKMTKAPDGYSSAKITEFEIKGVANEEWIINVMSGMEGPTSGGYTHVAFKDFQAGNGDGRMVNINVGQSEFLETDITGTEVRIYRIGYLNNDGKLEYCEGFSELGLLPEEEQEIIKQNRFLQGFTSYRTDSYREDLALLYRVKSIILKNGIAPMSVGEISQDYAQCYLPLGIYYIETDSFEEYSTPDKIISIYGLSETGSLEGTYGKVDITIEYLESSLSPYKGIKIEWDDGSHEASRPDSVEVDIYRDGEFFDTKKIYKGEDWQLILDPEELQFEDYKIEFVIDESKLGNYYVSKAGDYGYTKMKYVLKYKE